MKKILKLYKRWRYRRLFAKWFIFYIKRGEEPYIAFKNANAIFFELGGLINYHDWYLQEYFGIFPHSEDPSESS